MNNGAIVAARDSNVEKDIFSDFVKLDLFFLIWKSQQSLLDDLTVLNFMETYVNALARMDLFCTQLYKFTHVLSTAYESEIQILEVEFVA
jgi:hypothetical protein